jgi:hypothetical protein
MAKSGGRKTSPKAAPHQAFYGMEGPHWINSVEIKPTENRENQVVTLLCMDRPINPK